MNRALRRRIAGLVLMFTVTFATATRTADFDDIRTVQILLLMSSGMCLGVALSLYMQNRRSPSDTQN